MSIFEAFYGAKIAESVVNKVKGRGKIVDSSIESDDNKKSGLYSNSNDVDDAFEYISKELPEYVINQEEYLRDLCLAFKRPYLQPQTKSYKNMIFVFGPKGSGRKYSIRVLAKLLSIQGLIKESSIYHLDYSNYDTDETIDKLLLPDFYKAFNGKSSIVVLENFDQSCDKARDCLTNLATNGTLRLNKRFVWKNGQFVDATGSYEKESTDSIAANNKYIILMSNQSKANARKLFPRQFLEEISDFLETQELPKSALLEIAQSEMEDCASDIAEYCSLNVSYDNSFVSELVEKSVYKNGAHDIINSIEKNIHEPITELALKGKLRRGSIVMLSLSDGVISGSGIELSNLNKTNDAEELAILSKELDTVIGLDSVKEFIKKLEEHIQFERKSKMESDLSLHMIFQGNPGTGKTTIARLVARYLKALGCISSGHLVEVTRSDLVGQYMGQTAQKTSEKIKTALGGVLFIDEAYSLVRNQEDFFGLEAVDTIVKYMEDYRDDLVVILAGYEKEMQEFLCVNSGLKSRFNYVVDFPDYSPQEMVQIAKVTAKGHNFEIAEDCIDSLRKYFSTSQKSMKKDSGNGRLVRNTIEKAIINHSHRLSDSKIDYDTIPDLYVLTKEDFNLSTGIEHIDFSELDNELNQIVGLDSVKDFINKLKSHVEFAQHSNDSAILSLHMIFCGNPGTGKTTIARIVAKYLKALGVLTKGQLIEVSRADLVAGYQGQTAEKTAGVIEKAIGGILFIDEAYSLVRDSQDSFGHEAVDTIVKAMEDYRENLVVILAGYTKEMNDFLKSNSGLKSRFNYSIEFPDYTPDELMQITAVTAKGKNFTIAEECLPHLYQYYKKSQTSNQRDAGNGRLVRNSVEKAILTHSRLLAEKGYDNITDDDLHTLSNADFGFDEVKKLDFDLEAELAPIVGLEPVKDYLRSLYAVLRVNKARAEWNISDSDSQTMHMIFTGNPGTGKTTMARIVAKILCSMEILPTNKLVEVDRSSLVAGYVGQTAEKTLNVMEHAKGGVLFIDEAYALSQGGSNDFGREAIDTMVKYMEDHRSEIVVILAGYTENMKGFLATNPGLRSRFPNIIEFPNYSPEELLEIITGMYKARDYTLGEGVKERLISIIVAECNSPVFGNGRFARNLCEKSIRNLSLRISKEGNFTRESLTTIMPEDISL